MVLLCALQGGDARQGPCTLILDFTVKNDLDLILLSSRPVFWDCRCV